ncbi:MAG: hypothetical protein AAGJ81_15470 [Verrucomicrobiota bacterium]
MKSTKTQVFLPLVAFLLILVLSGCITTVTQIDEGDGVVMQEEEPLIDQVEIER